MATRKQRRKKYSGKVLAGQLERAVTRARDKNFEVRELQINYDAYQLLCKHYRDDMLEEILGVPLVIEDKDTPYEFGMTTNTLEHVSDEEMIEDMRSAVEKKGGRRG